MHSKRQRTTVSRHTLCVFVWSLIRDERYDMREGIWRFANGTKCSICTNSATMIAERFGGAVWGYWSADNPSAFIGDPYCLGHDFAIVSEHWLVDYWAYRISRLVKCAVLDIHDPRCQNDLRRLYGNPSRWELTTKCTRNRSCQRTVARTTRQCLPNFIPARTQKYSARSQHAVHSA